jgi:hypothetical protein
LFRAVAYFSRFGARECRNNGQHPRCVWTRKHKKNRSGEKSVPEHPQVLAHPQHRRTATTSTFPFDDFLGFPVREERPRIVSWRSWHCGFLKIRSPASSLRDSCVDSELWRISQDSKGAFRDEPAPVESGLFFLLYTSKPHHNNQLHKRAVNRATEEEECVGQFNLIGFVDDLSLFCAISGRSTSAIKCDSGV